LEGKGGFPERQVGSASWKWALAAAACGGGNPGPVGCPHPEDRVEAVSPTAGSPCAELPLGSLSREAESSSGDAEQGTRECPSQLIVYRGNEVCRADYIV